jgi:uncharacterized protein (TIGR03437 family)
MKLLLFFVAVAPLFAQNCKYAVSATDVIATGGSATGLQYNFTVTATPATCSFTATTNASWIHILTGESSLGNTVNFSIDQNTSTQLRSDVINILDPLGNVAVQVKVIQTAGVCLYQVSPTSATAPLGGASGTFSVTTGCTWLVSGSSGSWLTVPPSSGGIGNGSVPYTVAANSCVASRSGTITVSGPSPSLAFTVTQPGSPNNMTLSPSSVNVPQAGTNGTIAVKTGDGCSWGSVYADVSWIQITSTPSGAGTGLIGYHVSSNSGPPRNGAIHVGSATVSVTQSATPPPTPQLTAVVNGASFASGAISPGEIVTLFGSAMGPATGVGPQLTPDGGYLTNALGGVQVLFDGVPATLIYASANQVSVVVPYATAGQSSTQVQVQYQGGTSNTMQVAVQAAAPGIFTLDASGLGNGAILNQDYTINGRGNPATEGTEVMIYCTGGGVTNPASADGAITMSNPPLPLLTQQPIYVIIDGIYAQVVYSGGAPGAVAGLIQINAVVPTNLAPSPGVPVVVQFGNWRSQQNVTMAIQ